MKKNFSLISCLTAILIMGTSACGHKSKNDESAPEPAPAPVVTIDTTHHGLIIYYPPTDSIELRCFDRPNPVVDSSIVFCCAAAFTADWKTEPSHERIQGDHVSRGTFYQRPRLKRNTGAFFVMDDGRYAFMYSPVANPETFRPLFKHASTAFMQEMMIHHGARVKTTRPDNNANEFRALCLIGHRLCIADASEPMRFGAFIQVLLNAGATEALYLDMGPGWNYSWYREYADSNATWIHSAPLSSATNWLVFCQK